MHVKEFLIKKVLLSLSAIIAGTPREEKYLGVSLRSSFCESRQIIINIDTFSW